MNADTMDARSKLREPVDCFLLATPVEHGCPVVDERAQRAVFGSECPAVVDLVRPASPPQPLLEIVQYVLRHTDAKRIDAHLTSAAPRRVDGGDVDLLHAHHRLEGALGLGATGR